MQRSVGAEFLTSGLEAAVGDFVSQHALSNITKLDVFRDMYKASKADTNICLPYDAAELAEVEAAIDYRFKNKGLLELALTSPVKGDSGQTTTA